MKWIKIYEKRIDDEMVDLLFRVILSSLMGKTHCISFCFTASSAIDYSVIFQFNRISLEMRSDEIFLLKMWVPLLALEQLHLIWIVIVISLRLNTSLIIIMIKLRRVVTNWCHFSNLLVETCNFFVSISCKYCSIKYSTVLCST